MRREAHGDVVPLVLLQRRLVGEKKLPSNVLWVLVIYTQRFPFLKKLSAFSLGRCEYQSLRTLLWISIPLFLSSQYMCVRIGG